MKEQSAVTVRCVCVCVCVCVVSPVEAGSGQIAGIASAIGVALLGAASSYFAYQKKKLCFKLQGGQYVFLHLSKLDVFRMPYTDNM